MLFQKSFMSGVLAERERKQARVGREVASLPESRLARTHTRQPQRAATGRSGSVGGQIFSFIRLDGQGFVARLNSILDGAPRHVAYSYYGLEKLIFKGAKAVYTIRLICDLHIHALSYLQVDTMTDASGA